ncbi:MAG: hypothetical protein H6702_23265 [Myxococcales bacterium]|nr:hypothetical protein [Myxococcales bacterium]
MPEGAPGEPTLTCPVHPDRPANAACVECGRLVCAACQVRGDDGLSRCVDCLAAEAAGDVDFAPPPADVGSPEAESTPWDGPELRREPSPPPRAERPEPELPDWARRAAERGDSAEDEADDDEAPRAPAPAPRIQAGPELAWEADGLGDGPAFWQTALAGLRSPMRFPLTIPHTRTGDLTTPLVFALVCGVLGQAAAAVVGAFGARVAPLPAPPGGLPALPPLPAYVWDLLFMPVFPLVFALGLFAQAGIAHGLLGLIGARRAAFAATFRVFAYAQVGHLLVALPGIGRYAVDLYAVFIILGGLRAAHGAGFVAGMVALLPMMVLNSLFGG